MFDLKGMNSLQRSGFHTVSQIMQSVAQCFVWHSGLVLQGEPIVMGVSCQFLCIFDACRGLDWATKAIVVVALVVSKLFNLRLCHISGVNGNWVMNWESCGCFWIVVWDHEKVEYFVSIFFYNTLVNKCTRSWIDYISINFLEQSSRNLLVNKNIKDFWVITRSKLFDSLGKLSTRSFCSQCLLSHCWTSNSISVNNNLCRLLSFILFDI